MSFKNIKNEKVFLIFFSIILAVILSILKIYPLMTRLTLYLIPIVIIYVAKIVDFINVKNKILYYFILILYGFVLLLPMGVYSYRMVLQKEAWLEDILTPLKVANEMSASDDIYIIADGGKWLYEYYKNIIPIKNKVIIEDKYSDDVEYLKHLDSYKKGQVYYWIYAHNINKQNRLTSVYNWAKDKKQFYFVYDKSLNALIRFSP